jgi:hypothetical protein
MFRYRRRRHWPVIALIFIVGACYFALHGGLGNANAGQGPTGSMVVTSSTTCQGSDGGGPGHLFNFDQLEQLWDNAGGPVSEEQDAAAIGLAESGGCSSDLNTHDNGGTQTSFGIWQESDGTHNPPVADVLNPEVNAREAVAKYVGAGNSFSPWGTYTSGAFEAFLPGT